MIISYMPNSGHGGPPGTPFITIFVFHVNPQIPNTEYFEANEVYKSLEVSDFVSHQISRRMASELCLETHCCSSYDNIYKNIHFCKVKGREEERKEGRKEGRKGGREEGRKGGREEGRTRVMVGRCMPNSGAGGCPGT